MCTLEQFVRSIRLASIGFEGSQIPHDAQWHQLRKKDFQGSEPFLEEVAEPSGLNSASPKRRVGAEQAHISQRTMDEPSAMDPAGEPAGEAQEDSSQGRMDFEMPSIADEH